MHPQFTTTPVIFGRPKKLLKLIWLRVPRSTFKVVKSIQIQLIAVSLLMAEGFALWVN